MRSYQPLDDIIEAPDADRAGRRVSSRAEGALVRLGHMTVDHMGQGCLVFGEIVEVGHRSLQPSEIGFVVCELPVPCPFDTEVYFLYGNSKRMDFTRKRIVFQGFLDFIASRFP